MTAMIVDLKFRKNKRMMTTANKAPINALLIIVETDSSIGFPWSSVTDALTPSFSFSKSLIVSFTALTTSTVLASCDFVTWTPIERSPFDREIDSSIPLSSIVASCDNLTVGTCVGVAAAGVCPAVAVGADDAGDCPCPAPDPDAGVGVCPCPASGVACGVYGKRRFFNSLTVVAFPSSTTACSLSPNSYNPRAKRESFA